MTTPWGVSGAGGWADQVDEAEAKGAVLGGDDFPTLGAAAKKDPKEKKKKPVKMGLGAFMTSAGAASRMSDQEIRQSLPSRPLGREDGEGGGGGMGGAFKDYDNQRRGGFNRDDDDGGRGDDGPSRADTTDDWGKERKFEAGPARGSGGGGGFGGGGFRDREGGFQDREGGFGDRRGGEEGGPSRADESNSWSKDTKFAAGSGGDSFASRERRPGGFEDRGPRPDFAEERRGGGGFGERRGYEDGPSRADEGDWGSRRPLSPPRDGAGRGTKNYGFAGERSGEGVDRWAGRPGGAPEGSSVSGERPRLKLAPRTKPLNPALPPVAAPTAEEPVAADGEAAAPPRRRSNPFGAARPREEVLKEKGVDPVKEELKLEHHADLRDDTQEEIALKKEIEELRLQIEVLKAADGQQSEEADKLVKEADDKEMHLLKLAAELDDNVKYAKRRPAHHAHAASPAAAEKTAESAAAPAEEAAPAEPATAAAAVEANGDSAAEATAAADEPKPASRW